MRSEVQHIHEHGYVMLVDTMPGEKGTGDQAIVDAARVSYAKGSRCCASADPRWYSGRAGMTHK